MTDSVTKYTDAFANCVRCGYSLRGLAADHACPECGLAYDRKSEVYRISNPRGALLSELVLAAGGVSPLIVLIWLPALLAYHFSVLTRPQAFVAALIVALFMLVGFANASRDAFRNYRVGIYVVMLPGGLFVNLPMCEHNFVEWERIKKLGTCEDDPECRSCSLLLYLCDGDDEDTVEIGGMCRFFEDQAAADRFAQDIQGRMRSSSAQANVVQPRDDSSR